MNMGAGRVVYQDLTRIDKSISDGEFFDQPVAGRGASTAAPTAGTRCTWSGWSPTAASTAISGTCTRCSDGGAAAACPSVRPRVHRRPRHVADRRRPLPRRARHRGQSARRRHPGGSRPSSGRYYAMDRDKRWERTQARLRRDGPRRRRDDGAVADRRDRRSYEAGVTDEFISRSSSSTRTAQPVGAIRDGDPSSFFNFRADRARQITRALALDEFDGFERPARPPVHATTMTVYDRTYNCRSPSRRRPSATTSPTCSPRTAAPTSAWPRRRSTRTSPTSSTAAARSPTRRRPHSRAVAEGADLRSEAGDERPRHRRRAGRRHRGTAGTRSSSATSPTPTWSATPGGSTRRSPPSRRSTAASAGSSPPLQRRRHRDRHGRSRQRRTDVGRRARRRRTPRTPPTRCRWSCAATRYRGRSARRRLRCCDVAPTMLDLLGIPKAAEMTGRSLIE